MPDQDEELTVITPPAKRTRKKAAAAPPKPRLTFREKILKKVMTQIGIDEIPAPEVMFAKQIAAGQRLVPLAALAVVNDFGAWEQNNTELGKAMREIAPEFGERNVLNHSAEVDPARVVAVMSRLLMHGRLIHSIEASVITDEIPVSITGDAFDHDVLQTWTGRHRVTALAFIYGPEVLIPVVEDELTYQEAVHNCIESNSVRDRSKSEQIHHAGLLAELSGRTAAAQFELLKGKPRAVAEFVRYQCSVAKSGIFAEITIPIHDKASKKEASMTTPCFLNVVSEAISAVGADNFLELDETTQAMLNAIIKTANLTFEAIKHMDASLASTAWNAYSSGSIGRLIGQIMKKCMNDQLRYDTADVSALLARTVIGYIKQVTGHQDEVIQKSYVRTPVNEHVAMLRRYAASAGIVLPIVERSFIQQSY